MKKKLLLLGLALIAVCLAVVAYDRLIPAAAVHAACAQSPQVSGAVKNAHEAHIAQPVVVVGAGLVSALLGILAIAPLLLDEPNQANRGG